MGWLLLKTMPENIPIEPDTDNAGEGKLNFLTCFAG